MKLTPINGWAVAEDTDAVNQYPVSVDDPFKANLDGKVVPRFPTGSVRDAKMPNPTVGQVCYVADIGQFQGYSSATYRWLPIGGNLPYGAITDSTDQSFPAGIGTYTKWVMAGSATLQGGMSWNSSQNTFYGPAGVYNMSVRCNPASNAAASDIRIMYGNSGGVSSSFGGASVPANLSPYLGESSIRLMIDTGLNVWLSTTVARLVGSRSITFAYMGWPV